LAKNRSQVRQQLFHGSLICYLRSIQFGVSTPRGCEDARQQSVSSSSPCQSMSADHCIVKLDFSNAFGSLHGDVMLNVVPGKVPSIIVLPLIIEQSICACLPRAIKIIIIIIIQIRA